MRIFLTLLTIVLFQSAQVSAAMKDCDDLLHGIPDALAGLFNRTSEFEVTLEAQAVFGISCQRIRKQIKILEEASEAYFKVAKISYVKKRIKNTSYSGEFNDCIRTYNQYVLTGHRDGDPTSRRIFSVQKPTNRRVPAGVIYTPFFELADTSEGPMLAYYDADDNVVNINPNVIRFRLFGITDSLRHEMQHYFEQQKIENGEMTLARIVLTNTKKAPEDRYGYSFRLDEIETHIRDLRFLRSEGQRLKNEVLKIVPEDQRSSVSVFINEQQRETYALKRTLLHHLINEAKFAISLTRLELTMKTPLLFAVDPNSRNPIYKLDFDSHQYDHIEYQIPVDIDHLTSQDIFNSIIRTLDWSFDRISVVEKQLNDLS